MSLNTDLLEKLEELIESTKLGDDSEEKKAKEPSSCNEPPHPTYEIIPKFYHKLPKNADNLAQKLREEARSLFLQKRTKELLDNNELKILWGILERNHTQITPLGEQLIGYDDYLKVIEESGEKCRKYLTASLFARLQTSCGYPGKVSITSVFNYTMRKVWMQQTRIGLSLYDYTGQGFLRETVGHFPLSYL